MNFKKNEKAYDSTNSEVFKMLQEAKHDPPEPGNHIIQAADDRNCRVIDRPDIDSPVDLENRGNDFGKYLMLAQMLKYINGGSAFAENSLED